MVKKERPKTYSTHEQRDYSPGHRIAVFKKFKERMLARNARYKTMDGIYTGKLNQFFVKNLKHQFSVSVTSW